MEHLFNILVICALVAVATLLIHAIYDNNCAGNLPLGPRKTAHEYRANFLASIGFVIALAIIFVLMLWEIFQ